MKPKHFSSLYYSHVVNKSPKWLFRRRVAMILWLGRDCVIPLLPAHHAEHLHYKNLGNEFPWFDIVPMNRHTHRFVTWLKDVLPVYREINKWLLRGTSLFWLCCEIWLIVFVVNKVQEVYNALV